MHTLTRFTSFTICFQLANCFNRKTLKCRQQLQFNWFIYCCFCIINVAEILYHRRRFISITLRFLFVCMSVCLYACPCLRDIVLSMCVFFSSVRSFLVLPPFHTYNAIQSYSRARAHAFVLFILCTSVSIKLDV